MKVFVTGWDGLLGSSLVPRLREGHETAGMGLADGDIGDRSLVRRRLEAFGPDAVIHLAAMTAVDACESDEAEAFRVNAEGSRLVAAEAERVGASVLAISSDYVFDGVTDRPYTEDDEPRPLSVYGRSKAAAEEGVRGVNPRWTVVRSAWLFGPGGRNFVDTILDLLRTRETVDVVSDQTGSPTYAPDLAGALVALVEAQGRGVYHLVNSGAGSWYDLAREAARLAGLAPERVRPADTAAVGRPAPRPGFSVLDTARARERHGIAFRPWRDALRVHVEDRLHRSTAKEVL
jgi:dTDP-4-dehydrorhamnose reductase